MADNGDAAQRADQFLTTEHTALQTARSSTIFDSNGRAALFLTTVSSAIVALAFIGQVSEIGSAFFGFALVLFPTLLFLGVATFSRVLQSGVEDQIYARGINRIRHYYIEQAPQAERYFIQVPYDDFTGSMYNSAIEGSRWQLFLTTAGMVSVVNGVLSGVFSGLIVYVLGFLLGFQLLSMSIAAGVVAFVVVLGAHYREQQRVWDRVGRLFSIVYPSPDDLMERGTPEATAAAGDG